MRKWSSYVVLLAGTLLLGLAQAADTPAPTVSRNSIDSLQVSKIAGSTVLKLGLRQALAAAPSHFSIVNPARLVFDLPETDNGLGYTAKTINEGGLRSINIVQAGERSRLVLNLDKIVRFETRQEDKALLISLQEEAAPAAEATGGTQQHFAGSDKPGQAIRDIKFRRSADGAGVVVVDLTSSDTAVDVSQKGARLQLTFKKTNLPEPLRRKLDVTDFATPVNMVNTTISGDDVLVEVQPKGLWEHVAFQSDNQFIVEVRQVKEDPNKLIQGSRTGYQGEVISLNFQSIPVRELLHVFADISNFNIVVSDSVAGNVSLRLHDVPWDHALDIVLQQRNLEMRKSGNVIWIAPRDELAARDKVKAEARDAAVVAEVPRLEVFQLNYQKAEEFAEMLAKGSAPQGAAGAGSTAGFLSVMGRVTVDKRTNQLFIYDVPTKLDLIRGLLAQIDRPARQVLIEARIVEADTSFTRNLGARIGVHDYRGASVGHRILGNNNPRFAIGGGILDPGAHTGQTSAAPDFIRDAMSSSLPASNIGISQAGQFSLVLFNSAMTQFLNLELSALEADGKGKIISSPRVMTADGVDALIEQGVEIPYLQASSSGATSVSYRQANLSLKVKPLITPDNRIQMQLEINKDSPNTELSTGTGLAINKKHVKTEVLVETGGTVVIGGIFTQEERNTTTRVPLFGDLPLVGFLFRKNEKKEVSSELLVFITPKVVNDKLTVAR